ncbi:DUF4174 domain-containing protein [Maliponia aquimaris]|uniref:DUF4174 domain-containing protein n=1 Tax=Maliponia aquimaris TaxID=1673631 RepID=A0A238L573_9RHOB|nr:DUF4174 domain-containing protein [Maliponia aquimaris]SMX49486.1 hypothetical protein MAA8898_04311 [Maliponia aquimaris]
MKMTRRLIASALMAVLAGALAAQGAEGDPPLEIVMPAGDTPLEAWLWIKRPVVVFADSPIDPRFIEQMTLLGERLDALDERDVVVITDTDPAAKSPVRQKLRPRGFSLVLIAKDGTIVARKPSPWSVREISRSIDKLPLRQQELKLLTQKP